MRRRDFISAWRRLRHHHRRCCMRHVSRSRAKREYLNLQDQQHLARPWFPFYIFYCNSLVNNRSRSGRRSKRKKSRLERELQFLRYTSVCSVYLPFDPSTEEKKEREREIMRQAEKSLERPRSRASKSLVQKHKRRGRERERKREKKKERRLEAAAVARPMMKYGERWTQSSGCHKFPSGHTRDVLIADTKLRDCEDPRRRRRFVCVIFFSSSF